MIEMVRSSIIFDITVTLLPALLYYTINVERFAGLKFRVFNPVIFLQENVCGTFMFKILKQRHYRSSFMQIIFVEKLMWYS